FQERFGADLNEARLRMARIPDGAELISSATILAPGFKIGNVIVMAGVPSIMQAMMDIVSPKLKSGVRMLSDSVRANAREGDIGTPLRAMLLDGAAPEAEPEVLRQPADRSALVAFTSGTTGQPKGVVRPQGYLIHQHDIYTRSLGLTHHEGPDLCIFANFVLANLASGRPSLLVSPRWSFKQLRAIDDLPDELQPRTLSCGPAFLAQILRNARLDKLASVHVGGALSDVSLWENAFDKWPDTHFLHVYGSSEAEPVAVLDARKAVAVSRARGFHQVLCVGKPVDAIRSRLEPNSLWVTGPHVCRWYVGNDRENLVHKRVDEHGNVWHDMGDRIEVRDDLWWYAGRASQPAEDFSWEQSVYHELGHSRAFIHRTNPGSVYLVGEGLRQNAERIKQQYRGIDRLICCPIYRDRRHRARIDRRTTLRKGAPWLPG
ncbi:MAG TPA: AMP-binding protein, partial [Polyangiaceae bacterium]|nr:AMP-binding protein [Polyangiaceae bacterium]